MNTANLQQFVSNEKAEESVRVAKSWRLALVILAGSMAFLGATPWFMAAAQTAERAAAPNPEAARLYGPLVLTHAAGRTGLELRVSGVERYKILEIPGERPRIVIDLPRGAWRLKNGTEERGAVEGTGLIEKVRFAQFNAEVSRLVLDLAEPATLRAHTLQSRAKDGVWIALALEPKIPEKPLTGAIRAAPKLSPPPLADEMPGGKSAAEKSASGKNTVAAKAPTPQLNLRKPVAEAAKPGQAGSRHRPLIVLDAGHGGKDPGAIGKSGVKEKDVTLAAALTLRELLERTGRYEVALTRESDLYLPLEARVGFARDHGAALFLSLHADAGRPGLRGAAVYTLSEQGGDRAKVEMEKHDWAIDLGAKVRSEEVQGILVDLAQRETKNQSAEFAERLLPELAKSTQLLSNTHRSAGFYVLLAPDVPAALLEMGFLTDPQDEALLVAPERRADLMKGVARAVDAYFLAQTGRVAAAN